MGVIAILAVCAGSPANAGNGAPESARTGGEPKAGAVRTNRKDGAKMIYIPACEYMMGTTDEEIDALLQAHPEFKRDWFTDGMPRHKVTLSGFWIYKNLVTVGQYKKFCKATHHKMSGLSESDLSPSMNDHPVAGICWNDAKAYCDWAGVTLPTEAQWEHAARGPQNYTFPWGNTFDRSKLRCSGTKQGDAGDTAAVGSYPPNSFGLNDMAGNVWQWCWDWYAEDYYANSPSQDPPGPATGQYHSMRGGSWYRNGEGDFRCTHRIRNAPDDTKGYFGFRCAAPANPK
jgi:iron(II)-dependent oxidoreductase